MIERLIVLTHILRQVIAQDPPVNVTLEGLVAVSKDVLAEYSDPYTYTRGGLLSEDERQRYQSPTVDPSTAKHTRTAGNPSRPDWDR
jgi:hypothetical protein